MWNFPKGNEILGLDTTETSESWTKIIFKMFVSSLIRALAYRLDFVQKSPLPLQPLIIVGNWTEHLVSSLTHTTQLCMVIDYIATLYRVKREQAGISL